MELISKEDAVALMIAERTRKTTQIAKRTDG